MHSPLNQDLKKKVAELLVVRASGHALDSQRQYPLWELPNKHLKFLLNEGVGGVILHGGSVQELQQRCRELRNWSSKPLLLCADVEEGIGQRFDGGSFLPPPMAMALRYLQDRQDALDLSEQYGKCIGNQALKCGLNWVLAPVCDVNSNPINPVINMRAWGEDPHIVAELVVAFHKGLVSQGVLSCAKHFPGHGDTTVDSHLDLPIVEKELFQLHETELIPFKSLIEKGVNSVMTAHILFKNIDPFQIATFSKKFLTNLLRETFTYKGLIVTDALVMNAITSHYGCGEAAVMAFQAGADLILMPEDPFQAIDSITAALIDGRIPFYRLDQSIDRKQKEMSKIKSISLESVEDNLFSDKVFETTFDYKFTKKLIDMSIKFKNYAQIKFVEESINFVRVDNIFSSSSFLSSSSPCLVIPEKNGYKNILSHSLGIDPWETNSHKPFILERFERGSFLLQLFLRGNPFVGDSHFTEPWEKIVEQLQSKGRLSALIVYGSVYLWQNLSNILYPSIPSCFSPGQMEGAQEKILQTFFKANQKQSRIQNNDIQFTD